MWTVAVRRFGLDFIRLVTEDYIFVAKAVARSGTDEAGGFERKTAGDKIAGPVRRIVIASRGGAEAPRGWRH